MQVTLAGCCCRIPVGPPAPQHREHPAGLSSAPVRAPCPHPLPQLPRLPLEWLQEPVRRLSLGERPANGSQGPPDIPPSLPLKEKCPSELPSTLMHGARGVLLKAKASKRLSSPLERPKRCPEVTPISAVGVGVYPRMPEGAGTRGTGGAGSDGAMPDPSRRWRSPGCSRHGGVQGALRCREGVKVNVADLGMVGWGLQCAGMRWLGRRRNAGWD